MLPPPTTARGAPPTELIIKGEEIQFETPEGAKMSMSLEALFETLTGSRNSGNGMVLPDGVKMVFSRGPSTVWVHQSPPSLRRLKWIAEDSPVPFGEGARYREVTIALPYVIVLAIFLPGPHGRTTLCDYNEAFFCNRPLTTPDDKLCYPALLNCSKFEPQVGRPLSWICTQYLHRHFDAEPEEGKRFQLGLKALLSCLFETGFNYSSEHHELTSWFSESKSVDGRIASIRAWEQASAADALFALEVPWLETGLSVREIVERTFKIHRAGQPMPRTAAGLAGFLMNHAGEVSPSGGSSQTPDPNLPF